MDIRSVDGGIVVALSRRNLEHLLAGLDGAGQFGEFATPSIHRATRLGVLVVQAEENDAHYDGREPGPGMEPYLKGSH